MTKTCLLVLALPCAGVAHAQDVQPGYAAPDNQAVPSPPPTDTTAQPAPTPYGQWVLTQNGWVWVPSGATAYAVNGLPYAYLYTPTYGWSWYASPWGVGPFVWGPWIHRPWPGGYHAYRFQRGWHGGYAGGFAHRSFAHGGFAHGGFHGRR